MKILLRTALLLSPFIFAGGVAAQTDPAEINRPHRIISKPQAKYTDEARVREVEGAVLLKVTLLANGEIGEVWDVTRTNRRRLKKYGLIARAIEASRRIQFTPKLVDGKPVPVVVTVEYGFEIY